MSQYSLDNEENSTRDQAQPIEEVNDPPTEFTREQEITEDKRSVKTVIRGDDLASIPLNDEIAKHVVPVSSKDVSAFSCYECSRTKVKLMPIITEDRKSAYCCMRCITFEVLDIHFEEFLSNSEKYNGVFHNYLDNQKS